jgi:radical SAM superfamily enzyme YgiQ (UPF0313 family)
MTTGRDLCLNRIPLAPPASVLLIGPYDPNCGEYTFLAPPLGVWRLKGHIEALGHRAQVFDPNCCTGPPEAALRRLLDERHWDVIGVSTTGMTLQYDLALAHLAARVSPESLLVAGGMEATFEPELLYRLGPFHLVMLGEGEKPMRELLARLASGAHLAGIAGTAVPLESGGVQRFHAPALSYTELRDAIRLTPYAEMPYEAYWRRLEEAYRVGKLPYKAEREARLAEIRSVRLITLNYCPMACSFCSSTNFLHESQGSVAKIARLTAADCVEMLEKIVGAQPQVRTVIFQDDIFAFTSDKRLTELCEAILLAKAEGRLPRELQFISTNRIDAMTEERLGAMRRAGFRVVGFGVESFSHRVLYEFNKSQIYPHIQPMLRAALDVGLRPFLDLIMCSPRSAVCDVAETVRKAYYWAMAGCEIGLYPYVVPFSGAQMARDSTLQPQVITARRQVSGTAIAWEQPMHIMPIDLAARDLMATIVAGYEARLAAVTEDGRHLPSRARSLLWIATAIPWLAAAGETMPDPHAVEAKLLAELGEPQTRAQTGALA